MVKLVNDPVKGSSWITGQLRQAIQAGQYGHGDKLPAERQLAEAFGTSRTTVRAALDQLEAERLVSRRIGSGTFVNSPPRPPAEDVADQTSPLELIDVLASDWGAVQVQYVRATGSGRLLDCVEVLAHEIVGGKIVRTYHRPDQYAIDAFFC